MQKNVIETGIVSKDADVNEEREEKCGDGKGVGASLRSLLTCGI